MPVVTLAGVTSPQSSRRQPSTTAIGLPELIARSTEDYQAIIAAPSLQIEQRLAAQLRRPPAACMTKIRYL